MKKVNWSELLGWKETQFNDLRNAGFAYIRQGKYEIAKSFFQALVILEPNNSYNHQTLGAIYLELSLPNEALVSLEKALKLHADHSPTLLNFVKAQLMLGKKQEALKLAKLLSKDSNRIISNFSQAILLAYS